MAGGAKHKLTTTTARTICRAVSAGLPYKVAAMEAGVGEATLYRWLQLGRRDQKADRSSPEQEFWEDVQKALARALKKRIARIDKAGRKGDWKADAWWAEKMFPEIYGPNRTDIAELVKLLKAGRAGLADGGGLPAHGAATTPPGEPSPG